MIALSVRARSEKRRSRANIVTRGPGKGPGLLLSTGVRAADSRGTSIAILSILAKGEH
jgi:hypothetical protein